MQVLRGEVKAGGVKRSFIGVYVMFSTKKGRLWRSHTDRIIHGTKASESL